MTTALSPGITTRETDFSYYVKQLSTSSCGMIGIAERGPINQPGLVTSWEQFLNTYGGYIPDGYLAYAARSFFDNGGKVLYVNRVAHLTDPTDRNSLTAKAASVTLGDRRGRAATLETGAPGTDTIQWQATSVGESGNDLTVHLVTAGNHTPLSVEVVNSAISVHLATDGSGSSISTAAEVIYAVAQHEGASQSVTALSDDLGVVTPQPMSTFSGGLDPGPSLTVSANHPGRWGDHLRVTVAAPTRHSETNFNLVVAYRNQVVEIHRDLSMDESSPTHVEAVVNEASDFVHVTDLGPESVMPEDRPAPGSAVLTGGDNGLVGLGDLDYLGDPSQKTGLYAFDAIDALNILAVPGVATAPVIHGGLAYAERRKDLLFLAEPPPFLEPLDVVAFRQGQGMYHHPAFNTTYGALYYPWLEITDPLNSKKKLIPPTGAVAGCIARNDLKGHVWTAPAGIDRGRIFNVLNVGTKLSGGELDVLYPEGINPIVTFPDTGVVVWGQRTLTTQASAVDRINVRRLMMYLEESIGESSKFVVFEPNNPQTWRALIRLINPFLRSLQQEGGLYQYKVQCDEETNPPAVIDRNQMVARLFVKPTKTAEFVELNFILTTTGASFDEIYQDVRR